jgi:nitrous oxidase accessory protein NosD
MKSIISKINPYNEETIKEFVVSYLEDCGYSNVSVKVLFYQAKSNYNVHCEVRVIYTDNGKTLNNDFSQDLPKSSYSRDIP